MTAVENDIPNGRPLHDSSASQSNVTSTKQLDADGQQRQREKGAGKHGCKHYRRRCKLVSPCCGEVFWCRHCHNDVKAANEWDSNKRHELDRTRVREVVCALCELRQPVGLTCIGCGVAFGAYACLKCCFFEDDTSKQQFHCTACGICRVGGVHNFFHCHTCGCCYATSLQGNHVCVENSMRQNCPVCFEYLFDSVRPTAVLPCGHTIHSDCLREMERNRQLACPICMKSYADLAAIWRRVDEEVASTPMPEEYACWVAHILCNDCNQAGQVPFHILGLKCPHCSSYNTRRLTIDRNGPRPPANPPPDLV
ncbi:hypothetical protein CVIRNUC_003964 [Coccomyxa viridis]|uniref:Uncharacterized protein n=1 Tax=Coccomyxa viridis TaxID=1274662 RepID=A0AAV1I152_9CHLO|nr:hypothetical protein CVIRNUC_003964 [Coccomyxa viridis]